MVCSLVICHVNEPILMLCFSTPMLCYVLLSAIDQNVVYERETHNERVGESEAKESERED